MVGFSKKKKEGPTNNVTILVQNEEFKATVERFEAAVERFGELAKESVKISDKANQAIKDLNRALEKAAAERRKSPSREW